MKLVLLVVGNDAGGVAVLTPEHRVRASVKAFERRATQLETEAEQLTGKAKDEAFAEAASCRKAAKDGLADWQELVDRHAGAATKMEFEIRAYTYGEKLRARKEATVWENGTVSRFDQDDYTIAIVSAVTGKSRADIEALPPIVMAYLSAEIIELSEPDPGKLDFLPSSPSGSE